MGVGCGRGGGGGGGKRGAPTGGLEGLLTAVKAVGPEAGVGEAEEVVSKLAAAAAGGVGQVLVQHTGKVVGYRPACMGCSVESETIFSTCQLPMDKQVRPNRVKLTKGKSDDHHLPLDASLQTNTLQLCGPYVS